METSSKHLLVELWGCEVGVLDDVQHISIVLEEAVKAAGAELVDVMVHPFAPQGVSGVAVIRESHVSIHTWPEAGYAAVDVFTCGSRCNPAKAVDSVRELLGATRWEIASVARGGKAGVKVESGGIFGGHRR